MKTGIFSSLIILLSACAHLKERKMLREFPAYYKQLRVEGKFNSDSLIDYLYILTPEKELEKQSNMCVLILGNEKKRKQEKLLFDDLLPATTMSGKIDSPFETVLLKRDTLYIRFLSSPYGQNKFESQTFTFRFDPEKQFFSLVNYENDICMLPDCEFKASIKINARALVRSKLPYSYHNWLVSGKYLSSENCFIPENEIPGWEQFSVELNQLNLDFESDAVKKLISESSLKKQ